MENIIQKANELYTSVVEKNAALVQQKAKQDAKDAALGAQANKQAEKDIELAAREAAVEKIESIQKLLTDSQAAKADAAQATQILRGEKEKFEAEKTKLQAEVAAEKAKVLEDRKLLDKSWRQLREAQAKLDKAKAEYKEQVLEELKKKVG